MSACSRCGCRTSNPSCYVCDEPEPEERDGMDVAREDRERLENDE